MDSLGSGNYGIVNKPEAILRSLVDRRLIMLLNDGEFIDSSVGIPYVNIGAVKSRDAIHRPK